MKLLWQVFDRIASVVAVLTLCGELIAAGIKRHHISSLTGHDTDILIGVACLTIAGFGTIFGALVVRRNVDRLFAPGRGRGTTYVLFLGIILLIIALVGLLAL